MWYRIGFLKLGITDPLHSLREFLPPLFVFEYVNNADPAATGEKILINTATSSITGLITEFHKVSSIKSAGWGCRYI